MENSSHAGTWNFIITWTGTWSSTRTHTETWKYKRTHTGAWNTIQTHTGTWNMGPTMESGSSGTLYEDHYWNREIYKNSRWILEPFATPETWRQTWPVRLTVTVVVVVAVARAGEVKVAESWTARLSQSAQVDCGERTCGHQATHPVSYFVCHATSYRSLISHLSVLVREA